MNRFICSIVGTSLVLLAIGCSPDSPSGPGTTVTLNPEHGKFGISHLNGLNRVAANASVKEGANVNFNLGKIKGSTSFFFLLYNVGATPITDVKLTVANQSFSVFPSSMDTLIPGSDVGMLPIVKVSAFHGTPLDGVGSRPILAKGINGCNLQITGHTKTAAGTDTTVELIATMEVNAQVMDFDLSLENGKLALASPRITTGVEYGDFTELANKQYGTFETRCKGDTTITIENSGNTMLDVRMYSLMYQNDKRDLPDVYKKIDTTITAGSSLALTINNTQTATATIIKISGDNTIADPDRLMQSADGQCYFYITSGFMADCDAVNSADVFNEFIENHKNADCKQFFALIQDSQLFHAQECDSGNSLSYTLYSLTTGTPVPLYSRTGAPGNLIATGDSTKYGAMFDTIIPNLIHSNMIPKDLGLGVPVVGVTENWF